MTLDKSLRIRRGSTKARGVLKRGERITKLKEAERWEESMSVLGLPKVRVFKLAMKKKKKKKEEEGAEGAAAAATPAAGAAAGKAAAPAPKGAAPAKAAAAPVKGCKEINVVKRLDAALKPRGCGHRRRDGPWACVILQVTGDFFRCCFSAADALRNANAFVSVAGQC